MAAINQPQRAPNPWDALSTALNTGSSLYGIKHDADKFKMLQAQYDQDSQIKEQQLANMQRADADVRAKAERTSKNELNAQEYLSLAGNKNVEVSESPLKNAIAFTVTQPSGSPLTVYIKGKKNDLDDTYKQSQIDRNNALVKKSNKESGNSGKQLPPTQVLAVNEGLALPNDFKDLYTVLDKNSEIFGPVEGRFGRGNPYDEQAQTIDGLFRVSSQKFGRYMEGGVLRKEDEAKYRKMFPELSDTPALAVNKLQIIDRILKNKIQSDVKALQASGYDISAFADTPSVPELPKAITKGRGEIIPSAVAGDNNVPVFNPKAPSKEIK